MKKENDEKKSKKKEVNEKALKKVEKEKFSTKFVKNFKKRWLISGTNTILLIAIMIAAFILINVAMNKADFTAIDCTTDQEYTLTDESIERVADIDQEVDIYFVGVDETDSNYVLAKQYNKANSNINVEIIDATEDVEFANKYNVTNDDYAVIVESGDVLRTLYTYDFYTYDSDYNYVYIAEQEMTSAILNVTSGYIPKVYFLTGYTTYTLSNYYNYLSYYYLDYEVLTYEELNLLTVGEVPDDCDTLVIITPENDFDEVVADAIIDYINEGGNILWLNDIYIEDMELTNVNRVLAQYGVDGFEVGAVYETDENNILGGYSTFFYPEVQYTEITKGIYDGMGVALYSSTKINIDTDSLEDLNVEETDILLSSETSCFSKSFSSDSQEEDEQGAFILGTQLVKTIDDGSQEDEENESENEEDEETETLTSTLIIYGNAIFVSDVQISSDTYPLVFWANNVDLALNSIASLTNTDQDITIRKSYSEVSSFTPTDGQKNVIMEIIFAVPIIIIIVGLIIWVVRRRRV